MTVHGGAYNLTALADRLRLDGLAHAAPILDHDALSATILRPIAGQPFEQGPAKYNLIYVVIAGDGRFGSVEADATEATAGDVLFVPAGSNRRFTNLSRKFLVWRLTLRSLPT